MYVEAKKNDAKTAIPSPEFNFRIMSVPITGKGLCWVSFKFVTRKVYCHPQTDKKHFKLI